MANFQKLLAMADFRQKRVGTTAPSTGHFKVVRLH